MFKVFLSTVLFIALWSKNAYTQPFTRTTQDTCIGHIKGYSNFWKKDKQGKNGFRELMGTIIKNCNIVGIKWDEISQYLGKPNRKFRLGNILTFRYKLNQSNSPTQIGNKYLEVDIDQDGRIIKFYVWEVDG